MNNYEKLTQFIPWLQGEDELGSWIFDSETDGTPEHPKKAPHFRYSKTVHRFILAVAEVSKNISDGNYFVFPYKVLQDSGLSDRMDILETADVSNLSGNTIIAMLNAAIAIERFSDGIFGHFIKGGHVIRWLERLKEIDEQKPDLTSELLNRIISVKELSETLTTEVSSFLEDWRPNTAEELVNLRLGGRFSVDHSAIYAIDVNGIRELLRTCPDEEYDRYIASVNAIRKNVARMHTVCTIRDDVVAMICKENGIIAHPQSIYSALAVLAAQNDNLAFERRLLDDLIVNDDNNLSDNDGISLWDVDSFSTLYNFIQDIFPYYISVAKPQNPKVIIKYMKYVLNALDSFANGKGVKEFSFSFIHQEADEILYLSVSDSSGSSVSVTKGGSIYTPGVGSDSFTDWAWNIWEGGEEDGRLWLDIEDTAEMINLGAKLSIELPEEYTYDADVP